MQRRQFLKNSVATTASLTCASQLPAADQTTGPVIDVHQHVNFRDRPDATLVKHQKQMGVAKTILLPAGSPMNRASTRDGKGNGLAADVFGTQEAASLVEKHPTAYAFFCNEVPDSEVRR